MARLFVSAQTQYFELARAVVTAPPMTFACWFNPTSNDTEMTLVIAGTASSANHKFKILGAFPSPGVIRCSSQATTEAAAVTTGQTYSGNLWNHAAGTITSNTARAAYLNGGNKGTDTTNKSPNAPNTTGIGTQYQTSNGHSETMDGLMFDVAIWSAALTDGEVLALARGIRPRFIRPMSLVGYWTLGRSNFNMSPEPDAFRQPLNSQLADAFSAGAPLATPASPYLFNRRRDPIKATAFAIGARRTMTQLGVHVGSRYAS